MKGTFAQRHSSIALFVASFAVFFFFNGILAEKAEAKKKEEAIVIGYVSAFSGPLAQFTQSIKFIEEKALPAINKDGGIYIEEYGKKVPVKIIYGDTESNPTKASEIASKMILTDKVDFIVGAWTPTHINTVSAAAERHKIPALMENGPMASWLTGGPYRWSYGNLFVSEKMVKVYIDAWDTVETNKKVGFIFDSNVDGIILSEMTKNQAEARGYTIVDPGRFPAGTKDYTAIIGMFQQQGVDIVVANMITPDFGVAWNQFHQQGFVPKIFTIGKGLHFTTDAIALGGDLGNGLLSEDLWAPSSPYTCSLTGQTAMELTREFEKATGLYGDCTIGYDMSVFEIINDVFTRAGSIDRKKVKKALEETDLDTVYGHIKYNEKHVAEVPVVVSQWQKKDDGTWTKNVLARGEFEDIPLSENKLFFLPGSK